MYICNTDNCRLFQKILELHNLEYLVTVDGTNSNTKLNSPGTTDRKHFI